MQHNKYEEGFKEQVAWLWIDNEDGETKASFCRAWSVPPRSLDRWVEKYTRKPKKNLSSKITYVGTEQSITLYRGSDSVTVSSGSPQHEGVVEFILAGSLEKAWEEANYKAVIEKWSEGGIVVDNGLVTVQGFPVNNAMTDKLISMVNSDPKQAVVFARFIENLVEVGDQHVVDELYEFLKHNDIQLNEDGSFTGYKAVKSDYKDKYTGKLDNSPGTVVKMPRNLVNSNKHETCSSGLHVGSLEYAKGFASGDDKIVTVKVRPCNVVSVPVDYDGQKLRACEYEVVGEV